MPRGKMHAREETVKKPRSLQPGSLPYDWEGRDILSFSEQNRSTEIFNGVIREQVAGIDAAHLLDQIQRNIRSCPHDYRAWVNQRTFNIIVNEMARHAVTSHSDNVQYNTPSEVTIYGYHLMVREGIPDMRALFHRLSRPSIATDEHPFQSRT